MDRFLEQVFEHPSVLVIVIGAAMLLAGAAGKIPFVNPPLAITDPSWRIGLGSIGFVLIVFGVLLMWREIKRAANSKYKERAAYEGIRSPVRHYGEEEND